MIDLKVRVSPNMQKELDPTFGNVLPEESDAYIVFVTPLKISEYFFVCLIPEGLEKDLARSIIKMILSQTLVLGERYDVRPLNHEHTNLISTTTPMIGYDPSKIDHDAEKWEFYWLIPPRSQMN